MDASALPESVITIDSQYVQPERAAAYLIVDGDRAAFVDNNTSRAVPLLLEALATAGLAPEQVEYAIVTHVHLDHAGGTAALLEACPNAVALAHPRAVRHLVNPARLVQGVKMVYGDELFEELFGTVQPVPTDRVRAVEDGEALPLGARTLTFLHTPGHAKHHICVHDSGANATFTGDSFGVGCPSLQCGTKPFLLCSTAPSDFDAADARKTVQRILDTGAAYVCLAHFGAVADVGAAAGVLMRSIDAMEVILQAAVESDIEDDALEEFCVERVREAVDRQLADCGVPPTNTGRAWLEGDIRLNAKGLAYAAGRLRRGQ